jgi:hemolysin III
MERTNRVAEAAAEAAERVSESVRAKYEEVKPHLRGWMHAMAAPATLSAGIFLIVLSPTTMTRVGSSIFVATGVLLFTVSGIYHRGRWGPKAWAFLRRFDHANIFLLIAGSYTPFTLILLDGSARVVLLSVAWSGAILGVLFRIFWTHAPR